MKELNLIPIQKQKFKATTNSKHSFPVAPNLLKQDFKADAPCQKWVGDITCVRTDEGWLYLATVIDLFSRRVVGWALGARMTKKLVIDAINQAIRHESPSKGLIFHSDYVEKETMTKSVRKCCVTEVFFWKIRHSFLVKAVEA